MEEVILSKGNLVTRGVISAIFDKIKLQKIKNHWKKKPRKQAAQKSYGKKAVDRIFRLSEVRLG
jgi:hypothetical protein